MNRQEDTTEKQLEAPLSKMLERAGLGGGGFSLERIPGGANNRVYRVGAPGGTLLLKQYFSGPGDTRDRPAAEFAFSTYAWNIGIRCIPEPVAIDNKNKLALYGFVEGRGFEPGDIGDKEVGDAADFIVRLNENRTENTLRQLPGGAEACFTINEHMAVVDRRINRLGNMRAESAVDMEAKQFVEEKLSGLWKRTAETVSGKAAAAGIGLDDAVPFPSRIVSPSDFGFHNALRTADGGTVFIDFEYAGIDDPAKAVCDFFCQPAVPVPARCYDMFVQRIAGLTADPRLHTLRIEMLLPLYRIKWACIMLNDFLPAGGDRRRFAAGRDSENDRKAAQLKKARDYVAQLEDK